MKRSIFVTLFVVSATLIGILPAESDAVGLLRRGRGHSDCAEPCAQPCAQGAPMPGPQFVEQTVTRYKPVMKEREITENVTRCIPREERFKYTVQVPSGGKESGR